MSWVEKIEKLISGGGMSIRYSRVHPEKLIQSFIYLGFIINSKDMTSKLTEEEKKHLTFAPNILKNQTHNTICSTGHW